MVQFRPSVYYAYKEHSNSLVDVKSFSVPTYAEIKKNMRQYLEESYGGIVRVYRARRGEWGEWFEHWEIGPNGKPHITKQGWQ